MAKDSKRLDDNLATLADMSSVQLQERWVETGSGLPPSVPAALLRRLLAQKLQERRQGALPIMVVRELERMARKEPATAPAAPRPVLTNGTRLIREWNGQTITVEVVAGGFVRDGRKYRSLSEIAREATGAHWSGPRFFGLRRNG